MANMANMAKIRLLDPDTVNKIAAGEVIERPASVAKELIENSIDAGASRIRIEVAEGGKRLIRVTDDGCGIEKEDVVLAFQKHATSKISGAEDLDRIDTLGFRGEALSSIASVARSVEVHTKVRSPDLAAGGVRLRIEDGEVAEKTEVGCPAGTTIEVRDLFYGMPARRKYLKSARAELARITDVVTSYAIINPQIAFDLFTGKRTIFKSVRSEGWDDCILRILGTEVARNLVPVKAESRQMTISGVVGRRSLTRSGPDWIMVYVNGRSVRSRVLTRAVTEAYRTFIPSGRYPIAMISLEIDPALVDVNVHPTKREVRFLREEDVAGAVVEAVSRALLVNDVEASDSQMRALETGEGTGREDDGRPDVGPVVDQDAQRTLPLTSGAESRLELDLSPGFEKTKLRVLGQVLRLYIVAEGPEGLVLVDQHAAAERVRYEHLKKMHAARTLSQELITPINLELSPKEQLMLEDWNELLARMGFEIHPFGGKTYNVRSLPAIGTRLEDPQSVHDVLRDLFAMGKVSCGSTSEDDVLKLLACRGSIKAGCEMTWKEMHDLLKDLFSCQNPKTCPHGRPTVVTISSAQLEKIFGRR